MRRQARGIRMGQELTDRECALLSQQGDHAAYSVLVRRYQDRVYRFILRMVGSRDEAPELAQDVLIKAFQALPGWRPEAEFRTWLFRIASNTATDALRRRKVVGFVALDEDYDVPGEGAGIAAARPAAMAVFDPIPPGGICVGLQSCYAQR